MRLHRFYVSQPLGEDVVIKDVSVINQWSKVFRYKEGDFVILFNGDSSEYYFCIRSLKNKECTLKLEKTIPSFIPTKKINLYLSVIKKDNFELVVQKATELGVHAIIPILGDHSEKKGLNEERLRKIAIEASEQCGRGDIPHLYPITTLKEALESNLSEANSLVLQMGGLSFSDKKLEDILKNSSAINVFIGPEGGWSENEIETFKNKGLTFVSLGETVLRAETAAITACALSLLL